MTKVNEFNKWFAENYGKLREKCLFTTLFGGLVYRWQEDVFHNTYLAVYEDLKSKEIEDFESYFVSSYKKYCKIAFTADCKEIVPSEIFWKYQSSNTENEDEDLAAKEDRLNFAGNVQKTAKKMFSKDEYTIFTLYFVGGYNFSQIADFFGVKCAAVTRRYQSLCSRLGSQFSNVSF